jgi:hypothetical protein
VLPPTGSESKRGERSDHTPDEWEDTIVSSMRSLGISTDTDEVRHSTSIGMFNPSMVGSPFAHKGAGRFHLESGWAFQNINNALHSKAFRGRYLRSLRSRFKIVGLAETQSSEATEELWQREWGSGVAIWASGTELSPGTGETHTQSRGVALLMTDEVMAEDVKIVWKDPAGRTLVVTATIYGGHKVAIVVSHVPCDPTNGAAHVRSVEQKIENIPDIGQRLIVWAGAT